jgi:coenzyme PQQ precursor peptide PqqA
MFTVDPFGASSLKSCTAPTHSSSASFGCAGILPKDPKATATKKPLVLRMPERLLVYQELASITQETRRTTVTWATPRLIEICIGLEINGYLPPEF